MVVWIILLGCLLFFLAIEALLFGYGRKQEDVETEWMIILGAGLHGDRLSSGLTRRLNQGLLILRRYPKMSVVVSGGQGKDELRSEASAMKEYLMANGIQEERIVMEDKSVSTSTNFQYTQAIIGACPIVVTSCDFHMFRATRMAKYFGFMPYRNPAKCVGKKCVKYYIREFFCVCLWYIRHK